MIYKITFDDGRIDWCTAKDKLHLLKSYDFEFDLQLQEIENIEKMSEEQSKNTMVVNSEFDHNEPSDMPEEFSIWELAVGDDFCLIATTEFD